MKLERLTRIDWRGFGATKGRPVYARTRTEDTFSGINFKGGFLVGWDQWSDGQYGLCFVGPRS